MNILLTYLIKKGAHRAAARISTTEIGQALGMSQQNASRMLLELESEGKIKRDSAGIRVEEGGLAEVRKEYLELKRVFEGQNELVYSGTLIDGLGEGSYYIRKYAPFIELKLGYAPYFGTLNIRLDDSSMEKRPELLAREPIMIERFEEQGRSYGEITLYPCLVNGKRGAVVLPARTHHGKEILEVITEKKAMFTNGKREKPITVKVL
ncbi:MAG: DUF120 domain-containing protein [Candidatus Micrarchaeia archaeon]